MDGRRFDALTRAMATETRSRRGALRLLATSAVVAGLARLGPEEVAAACRPLGKKCAKGDKCCGGARCKGGRCRCAGGTPPCNGRCLAAGRCCPGETRSCYGGPDGTAGVGVCTAGIQTCGADGSFGACEGEVPPTECCTDDDCEGTYTCQADGTCRCPYPADTPCGQSGHFDVDACLCVCNDGPRRVCESQCKSVCTPIRHTPQVPNGTYSCGGAVPNGTTCGCSGRGGCSQCCGGVCCVGGACEGDVCTGGCDPNNNEGILCP